MIYWAAKSLGLEVKVKPVLPREQNDVTMMSLKISLNYWKRRPLFMIMMGSGVICVKTSTTLTPSFGIILLTVESAHNHLLLLHITEIIPRKISYQAAAILIAIPDWSS